MAPDLRIRGALGGTRTPNLLIRSQMLYPLSYERRYCSILHSESMRVRARAAEDAGIGDLMRTGGTRLSRSGTTGCARNGRERNHVRPRPPIP